MGKKTGRKRPLVTLSPRMQQYLDGEITIDDMDDEEIAKGRFRSADGTFKGRPPQWVPRKFYDEIGRRQIQRAEDKFKEMLGPLMEAQFQIAMSSKSPDARMKAGQFLIERAVGKVTDKSEIQVSVKKWEADIEGILTDVMEDGDQ